jgi:hypothetical protein
MQIETQCASMVECMPHVDYRCDAQHKHVDMMISSAQHVNYDETSVMGIPSSN